jgi:hypothetical protein
LFDLEELSLLLLSNSAVAYIVSSVAVTYADEVNEIVMSELGTEVVAVVLVLLMLVLAGDIAMYLG